MRQSVRRLATLTLACGLIAGAAAPAAQASIVGTAGHILKGAGGALLSAGKSLACKGLNAAGTVASGATTVAGAAIGGAETGGAGVAAGGAAGKAAGGVLKKGVGVLAKAVCSSGGSGIAGTLAKAAGAAAAFDFAAHWMIGAASKVTAAVVAAITHSTSPQVNAAWFRRSFAPMAALGGALALLVTLIALASAALRRNPDALAATLMGVLRAGLGTGLLLALTTIGLQIADEISADVINTSHQTFWSQVGHAWGSSGFGGFGSSALAMLMAIIQVIAGVLVWLELSVRNAAIYLAVLFFPVALAASIWPNLSGWTSRLGRLLLLFVLLKPVTIVVLAFAGNAALAGLSLNGSLGSSAGTIIAAITIFALAAMAPWALMLVVGADAESAAVGAGLRAAAGHAASDGAARLGRVGGRISSGLRGGGAGGVRSGGAIRAGGSRGSGGGPGSSPGPTGPGGPTGRGGGGGPTPVPEPDLSGGGTNVEAPSGAPSGVAATAGRGTRSRNGAPAEQVPIGAVALAAGMSGGSSSRRGAGGRSAADDKRRGSGGATRMPSPSGGRSGGGTGEPSPGLDAPRITPPSGAHGSKLRDARPEGRPKPEPVGEAS